MYKWSFEERLWALRKRPLRKHPVSPRPDDERTGPDSDTVFVIKKDAEIAKNEEKENRENL